MSPLEFDPKAARSLAASRSLSTIPGLQLPSSVQVTPDLANGLKGRSVVVSATPSHCVRATMKSVRASGTLEAAQRS